MKKCPNCKQLFSADYAFCLEDGSTLFSVPEDEDSMPTVNISGAETQTQVYLPSEINRVEKTSPDQSVRPTMAAAHSAGHSKWIYILLGSMATIIIVLGISFYLNSRSSDSKADSVKTEFQPGGKFKGEWTSEKGGLYTAELTLSDEGANQISGYIVWTLRRSSNEKKNEKAGMTAVEYVQGTYEPLTRMISFTGYKKNDPNDLIVLDSYRLTLAEDNRKLGGSTRNQGKWSGRLSLERTE